MSAVREAKSADKANKIVSRSFVQFVLLLPATRRGAREYGLASSARLSIELQTPVFLAVSQSPSNVLQTIVVLWRVFNHNCLFCRMCVSKKVGASVAGLQFFRVALELVIVRGRERFRSIWLFSASYITRVLTRLK